MQILATLVSALLCSTAVFAKGDHQLMVRSPHHHLQKRFSGTATYYIVGLGACGKYNVPSDHIVALNTPQYGGGSPGPQCFKQIRITARGKSAIATIMDECPTCGYGSLDLSQGLFEIFAPTSDGVFQMNWEFVDGSGGGDGGNDKPKEEPKTTKHTTTHHTTHYDPPTTTSTKPKPTTTKTTSTTPRTTHTPTTSKARTTTTSSSSAPATTTSVAPSVNNLEAMNQVILNLEDLLDAATGN